MLMVFVTILAWNVRIMVLFLRTVLLLSFCRVVLGKRMCSMQCAVLMYFDPGGLVVVILTQQNQFHSTRANTRAQIWKNELGSINKVFLLHLMSCGIITA